MPGMETQGGTVRVAIGGTVMYKNGRLKEAWFCLFVSNVSVGAYTRGSMVMNIPEAWLLIN